MASASKRKKSKKKNTMESAAFQRDEIILWVVLAFSIILCLSNFGIGGNASLVEALLNEKTAVEDIMTQAIEAENTKDTSKSVSGRAENLRGSSVTQILYYINENHLVLAVTGDSSALLLTGYDTKNVSVYDPVTSETTTMAIADAQEYFEAYDCAFFAWIK